MLKYEFVAQRIYKLEASVTLY